MLINAIISAADDEVEMIHLFREFELLGVGKFVNDALKSELSSLSKQLTRQLKLFEGFSVEENKIVQQILSEEELNEQYAWLQSQDVVEIAQLILQNTKNNSKSLASMINVIKYLNLVTSQRDKQRVEDQSILLERMIYSAVKPTGANSTEVEPVTKLEAELTLQLEVQQQKIVEIQKSKLSFEEKAKDLQVKATELYNKASDLENEKTKMEQELLDARGKALHLTVELDNKKKEFEKALENSRTTPAVDNNALLELKSQLTALQKSEAEWKDKCSKLTQDLDKMKQNRYAWHYIVTLLFAVQLHLRFQPQVHQRRM